MNSKLKSGGETLILFLIVAYIGEGIKWLLKWLVYKPIKAIAKGFFLMCIWVAKGIWYTLKFLFNIAKITIINLYKTIKNKVRT